MFVCCKTNQSHYISPVLWSPLSPLVNLRANRCRDEYLFVTVLISRTNAYARTGLMVNFLPAKKKIGSLIHIIIRFYNSCTYILERLGFVSTAANESILAPFSKQTESFRSQCDMRLLDCFPCRWLGLAIFSLACQILLLIKGPNPITYKSHRYTSHLKQHITQHRTIYKLFFASSTFTLVSWRGLLGPNTSVRHNNHVMSPIRNYPASLPPFM